MIKKMMLLSICMFGIGVSLCDAQGGDFTTTNWGESIQGIQLSIKITTNVFKAGSSATFTAVTRNSSANFITVDATLPVTSFDVILTNNTGEHYHIIKTPSAIGYPTLLKTINHGEESTESIPMTFGETRFGNIVEPGDYTLKATRKFTLNDKEYTVESR